MVLLNKALNVFIHINHIIHMLNKSNSICSHTHTHREIPYHYACSLKHQHAFPSIHMEQEHAPSTQTVTIWFLCTEALTQRAWCCEIVFRIYIEMGLKQNLQIFSANTTQTHIATSSLCIVMTLQPMQSNDISKEQYRNSVQNHSSMYASGVVCGGPFGIYVLFPPYVSHEF